MLSNEMRTIGVDELGLSTLKYLASQVMGRPLMYGLVQTEVHRWQEYTPDERRQAMQRAVRRVGSVCPWVRTKPRVIETMQMLG
jgi:hypothetical protein